MEDENLNRSCSSIQKLCYGLGHVYNDLCAAMWFSYTLFYLQIVLQMESNTAGTLIMLGQVVDSLATPLAGWAVDKSGPGRQRVWHLAGTVAVSVGFSLIYSLNLQEQEHTAWTFVYYAAVIILFQIGWAVVQISHLSIIPEISSDHAHSSDLTAIRYSASVCCNIFVYIITLIILKNGNELDPIGPNDFYKFKQIALIIIFTGVIASLIFYCGTWNKVVNQYEPIAETTRDVNGLSTNKLSKNFFKTSIIYSVSVMYMASRLFTTLNLIYIPLYLDENESNKTITNDGIRETIASVPLVAFTSSFITSIFLKYRSSTNFCADKVTYLSGSLISLAGCFWIGFGVPSDAIEQIYIIAVLIGIGGSSTMVSSLCLTADFVKVNGFGGAAVYSTVTFTDKLVSGGVVLLVQYMQCKPKSVCPHYYQHVLCYVCAAVSIVGLLSLAALRCQVRR